MNETTLSCLLRQRRSSYQVPYKTPPVPRCDLRWDGGIDKGDSCGWIKSLSGPKFWVSILTKSRESTSFMFECVKSYKRTD